MISYSNVKPIRYYPTTDAIWYDVIRSGAHTVHMMTICQLSSESELQNEFVELSNICHIH